MKKYLRFSCTVCKRFTDKLVDNTHAVADKCTITFKCTGILFPVQYKSDALVSSRPISGVEDWRPRNSSSTLSKSEETIFVNTSTGLTKQIVVAVQLASPPSVGSTFKIKADQQSDTPKKYRQYVYRLDTSFSTISGVEAGLEKKTLRYSTSDVVEVLLNGVKLAQGTGDNDFQIYDGTSTSGTPPNTIKFNQVIALPGTTQVDVIISTAVSSTQIELTFTRNQNDESRLKTGSWENVDFVKILTGSTWQNFYLFTLDLEDSALKLNTILTLASSGVVNGITTVQAANIKLLLARDPYSILDRYTSTLGDVAKLQSGSSEYLKYFLDKNDIVLYMTSGALQTIYPPATIIKFNTEKTIQTALAGTSDQIVVDGAVIVGPDQ